MGLDLNLTTENIKIKKNFNNTEKMKTLKFSLVLMAILYVGHTDSYEYDLRIVTSNRTFTSVPGKFYVILDSFSVDEMIDEQYVYSNTT